MPSSEETKSGRVIFTNSNIKRVASVIFVLGTLLFVMFNMRGFDLLLTPKAQLRDMQGNPLEVASMLTASELCLAQLDNRYRGSLLSRHVDDHSSRFDVPRQVFLVFLYASIGEPTKAENVRIHCHVRPGETMVNYFGIFDAS